MKQFIWFLMLLFFPAMQAVHPQKREVVRIQTPQGTILVWLYDQTPRHKASFLQLARDGYFNSFTINRVVRNFVIQGGCPDTEEGFTDPDMLLTPEFDSTLRHEYGTFAAGRDDNPGMLSARCQFYIVQNKAGLKRLDDKYTVFGKVIQGMPVVEKIASLSVGKSDEPLEPVTLKIDVIRLSAKKIRNMGVHL